MRPLPHSALLACLLTTSVATAQAKGSERDLLAQLQGEDAAVRLQAANRLVQSGGAVVPGVLRELRRTGFDAPSSRYLLEILARLGGAALSALPDLIEALSSARDGQEHILAAIDRIAPHAPDKRDELIESIGSVWVNRTTGNNRRLPVRAIAVSRSRLDVHRSLGCDELIRFLQTGNSVQRETAAELIVDAGGDVAARLDALRRCFEDNDRTATRIQARFKTATMSASIGTAVRSRAPEKLSVARAIARLAPTREVAAKVWIALLDSDEPPELRRAMQALGAAPTEAAVPRLLELTRHLEPTVRWEAITTLGVFGRHATTAVGDLEGLAKSPDRATAVRAAAALRTIRAENRKYLQGRHQGR